MASRLLIIGGGESGTGAALLAIQRGWTPFVADEGGIAPPRKAELDAAGIAYAEHQRHLPSGEWSRAVVSPGVAPTHQWVVQLRRQGVPVEGEIDFAFQYETAPVIAVTGSNGKTTTTLLIAHILRELGREAAAVGNVGTSYARSVADAPAVDYRVVEVSSFQLEHLQRFHPRVAVLTNVTPDHLDRHGSLESYIHAKMNIFRFQGSEDAAVLPTDADLILRYRRSGHRARRWTFGLAAADAPAVGWEGDDLVLRPERGREWKIDLRKRQLVGPHNQRNIAAAVAATVAALPSPPPPTTLQAAIASFRPVPHRLEYVATIGGVKYYNDSKATNADAARYALEAFHEPIVWIAGGIDKGNDYSPLQALAKGKVRYLIVLGPHRERWTAAFEGVVPMAYADDMESAVRRAAEAAQPGDVVLLSPACASFDLFRNFEERGEAFRRVVRDLNPSA